jgi:hypothetical protein
VELLRSNWWSTIRGWFILDFERVQLRETQKVADLFRLLPFRSKKLAKNTSDL